MERLRLRDGGVTMGQIGYSYKNIKMKIIFYLLLFISSVCAGQSFSSRSMTVINSDTGRTATALLTGGMGNSIRDSLQANISLKVSASSIFSGSFSQVGTATTVFTVTIGTTQPNTTYRINITPTAALSAALFYVTNKTTTTFDVTYLAGLTGTVTFDWALNR